MSDRNPENTAVWKSLEEDYRSNRSIEQISRDLNVVSKTIRRWSKNGAVSDEALDEVKLFLEGKGIDWRKRLNRRSSVYDIERDYWSNIENGPRDIPTKLPDDIPSFDCQFLGKSITAPIAVTASVATANSEWIKSWYRLAFSVAIYKTVRLVKDQWPPHTFPQIAAMPELTTPYAVGEWPKEIVMPAIPYQAPSGQGGISLSNSVGMPSPPTTEWMEDIRRAKDARSPGNLLIVSVVGTGNDPHETLDNFIQCAVSAASSDPDALELNLSCPNVFKTLGDKVEGDLYQSPEKTAELLEGIKKAIGRKRDIPILVKIGYLAPRKLEQFVEKTRRLVAGYSAINTIPTSVLRAGPRSEFTPFPYFARGGNPRAGVSGIAIRAHAFEVIVGLNSLRKSKSEFAILGVGGVSSEEDALTFLKAGADVVGICTAAMYDRFLAVKIRRAMRGKGYRSINSSPDSIISLCSDPRLPKWFDQVVKIAHREGFRDITVSEIDSVLRQQLDEVTAAQAAVSFGATEVRGRSSNFEREFTEKVKKIRGK